MQQPIVENGTRKQEDADGNEGMRRLPEWKFKTDKRSREQNISGR